MKDLKPKVKDLDKLWAKVIKLRAGMQSEYGVIIPCHLAAHHIIGKQTLALRYNLDNGVCITTGQHHYVAHNTGRSAKFKQWALDHRSTTEEHLMMTSRNRIDHFAMKLYLEKMIEVYK